MTQEEVAILWKDANGWDVRGYKNTLEDLERFANLVAAKEREACAKECEFRIMGDNSREDLEARKCATAIRTRGEQHG